MKLSILMPVYNESTTILDILNLVKSVNIDKEVIVVDDSSTDGTRELLKKFFDGQGKVRVIYHERNRGKGAAVRTALSQAGGDYMVVQDARMDYSPREIPDLVREAERTGADAVFGSRFMNGKGKTPLLDYFANKGITLMGNILFSGKLSDIDTCYKMVRTDVVRSLDMRADRSGFEPELAAKLLKKGIKIQEVPISYRAGKHGHGKKRTWKNGMRAVGEFLRIRFTDNSAGKKF